GNQANILETTFCTNTFCGTFIQSVYKPVSRRKYWLAYQTQPAGTVFVDQGAANALLKDGHSLLPGGIYNVQGIFPKGALVRIVHGEEEVGVGLSNYSAQEIRKIMGLKRLEVAACLGNAHYPCVVHRDNLLLHAVL
ncbi:MAG: glutamate 5-kinase, partial [Desulfovibrio sp.]|nr:glutamate 5-kinase [Desulfovibrio sp.]